MVKETVKIGLDKHQLFEVLTHYKQLVNDEIRGIENILLAGVLAETYFFRMRDEEAWVNSKGKLRRSEVVAMWVFIGDIAAKKNDGYLLNIAGKLEKILLDANIIRPLQ